MKEFNLYLADCTGNAANCLYSEKVTIRSKEDLKEAIKKDHVCAKYKRSYRSKSNFISSNVIAMDVDNEDDDEREWLYPYELANIYPGLCYYVVYSRNNNKQKGNKSPRPRFHVFFPIDEITNEQEYSEIKQYIAGMMPYVDDNAIDSARFFFGSDSIVEYYDGNKDVLEALDESMANMEDTFKSMDQLDDFEKFDKETLVIKQGSRNSTMSHIAGRIIKRLGSTDEAYKTFLKKSENCNPPLGQEELDAIWHSAVKFGKKVAKQEGYISPDKYNAKPTFRPDELTDMGQARMLAEVYKDVLAYTPSTDFVVYNGSFWEEDTVLAQGLSQELTLKQMEEAKAMLDKAIQDLDKCGCLKTVLLIGTKKAKETLKGNQKRCVEKLEEAQDYQKYVLKRQDSRSISATLKEVKSMVQTSPDVFDKDEFLLNTPNFTYDLRKGIKGVGDHNPNDKITKQTTCDPSDEGKDIWINTLNTFFESDKDLIEYVQTIVGLAAIGKVYVEALIISYGEGKNGKSTFWNAISKTLGTYSGNLSADMLTAVCRRNVKPELAEAKGKRIMIAAELQEGMRLNTSNVKQLCSTDDIYAEKKYKAPFAFTPSHTLVLYTNHLPKVGAVDKGTWRRLIVIPFTAELNGKNEIKNYADYLVKNAGGYILTWIIEGAKKAIEKEFKIELPEKVNEAIKQYRDDNNWFSEFIDECCEKDSSYLAKSGELYQEYRMFCSRSGEFARSTTDFYASLRSNGFERKRTNKGSFILGIRLKSEFLDK